MKKIIIGAFAIIAVSAAFILAGCEKEEATSVNTLNIQKSNANLSGMYEVVDETGGVFLNLEDSNYISMTIVREPASGTGYIETVKDKETDLNTGIIWHCDQSKPATNCGIAREVDDVTGETIRVGKWVEDRGALMVMFEP